MATDGVTLRFLAPSTPLSINKANSMHWAARKRYLKPWREAVRYAWLGNPSAKALAGIPCDVYLELPFPQNRRRDPHNYVGTMTKAIVDELVGAGAWPDDTADWVHTFEPVLIVGHQVTIRLLPKAPHPTDPR